MCYIFKIWIKIIWVLGLGKVGGVRLFFLFGSLLICFILCLFSINSFSLYQHEKILTTCRNSLYVYIYVYMCVCFCNNVEKVKRTIFIASQASKSITWCQEQTKGNTDRQAVKCDHFPRKQLIHFCLCDIIATDQNLFFPSIKIDLVDHPWLWNSF